MPQEEKYGTDLDVSVNSSVGNSGDSDSAHSALRTVIDTPLERLPPEAITRCVEILSTGAVLCAFAFIVLSFLYPDRVTTAVSILAPLATLLIQQYMTAKRAKNKQPEGE